MKHIKMVLYGEPGVGKSVFASKFPKPFFICTDGNYEFLEDFGADPKDHVVIESWEDAKKVFKQPFDGYETIVLDLVEDLFKWCEYEFCVRNRLEHISDLGYAKGYDATRTEFFVELCKLLAKEKNIVMIMHGFSWTVKDRRGVEKLKSGPTDRIPGKVMDMIEGRVRYFLRCYVQDVEQPDGTLVKERFLSLVPKANEFGIIRGVDETKIPQDIPLDFNEFAKWIGFDEMKVETKVEPKVEPKLETVEVKSEPEPEVKEDNKTEELKIDFAPVETTETKATPEVQDNSNSSVSNADKMAAIKAKLQAMGKI